MRFYLEEDTVSLITIFIFRF